MVFNCSSDVSVTLKECSQPDNGHYSLEDFVDLETQPFLKFLDQFHVNLLRRSIRTGLSTGPSSLRAS